MNKMKKLLSFLLALSMVLSYVPMPGLAEEVCTHHTHDNQCGYVEAVEGVPCNHQCGEDCPTEDVTVCVHDHAASGCVYTPAAEAVACDHVHGEACGYVPAQAAVPCTCGAEAAHTAECASLVTEGADCDCGMPVTHAEGCEPKAAVAEQCSHVHGACAYKAAVQESWGCGHVCTKDSGCVKAVCAHAHDASCGYVQAVKDSDCTFVCTECKAEEKTCTCGAAEEGEDEHAPFCDLYVRTHEECKCVLDCAVEGLNDWCETCYFEGVEACGASGEEEDAAFAETSGTCGDGVNWELDSDGVLTISGNGAITAFAFKKNPQITKVIISENVTAIGNSAFYGCINLTTVTIKGNIATIGGSAFSGCSSLTTVTIKGNITTIGRAAFSGSGLTAIYYYGTTSPSPSPSLPSSTTVYVPKGSPVTSFGGAPIIQLEDSSTPDETTTYAINATATPAEGGTASGGCNVNIGTNVTVTAAASDGYKFVNWTENGTVVSTANPYTFTATADRNLVANFAVLASCTVTATADPTEGGTITFSPVAEQYTEGTNITLVATAGDAYRFVKWTKQDGTEVSTNTSYTHTVTEDCELVAVFADKYSGECGEQGDNALWKFDPATGVLTISGTGAMKDYSQGGAPWYDFRAQIKSVVIKKGITIVSQFGFHNCDALTSVTIPDSVTSFHTGTFDDCDALTSFTIPPQVKSMGQGVFTGCSNLTSVTISAGVEIIPANTFASTPLTSITIPASVKNIGLNAFYHCEKLTTVNYLGLEDPVMINEPYNKEEAKRVFQDCNISGITVNVPAGYQSEYFCGLPVKLAHEHQWEYTANGTTITAACTAENCPNSNGSSVTIAAPAALTYTGNAVEAVVSNNLVDTTVDVKVVYTPAENLTEGKPVNSGTYTAAITLGKASVSVSYTVTKADPQVEVPTGLTATYGDTLADVELPTGWTWDEPSTSVGDVGSHEFAAVYSESQNYNAKEAVLTVTVAKAKAEITVDTDPITVTYGETVTLPTATTNLGTVTCDKTASDLVNTGTYTVTYSVAGTDNYDGDTKTVSVAINAKTITEADVALNGSLVYTGEEQTQQITVTDGITYEISGNKATNVGTYELTVKGTGNYTGEVKLSWNIKAAAATVETVPVANDLTYTGVAQPLVTAGTSNGGEMQYSTDNQTWSATIPTGTNAGEYTVYYKVVGDENHTGTDVQSVVVNIAKAAYDMTGAKWNYTDAIQYDGKQHTVEVIGLPAGVTVSGYTGNNAERVGEYTAKVTFSYDTVNYEAPALADLTWTIINDWTPTEYTVTHANSEGWLNEDFTLTAQDGYLISSANSADGEWKAALTFSADTDNGSVTFYLENTKTGAISLEKTETYKIDKTPATGKITIGELTGWEAFVNSISFNLFFKDMQTVTITSADTGSGVQSVEYYASATAMTLEEVEAVTDWSSYNGGVNVPLEDAKKFVYFAKITDKAGNVTYLSTDGAVYDTAAPVIGIEPGTYYTTQTVTVTEANLDTLTLNGKAVTSPITLDGDKDTTYTIVAKDKAGHQVTVTVTMKTIASLDDSIGDLNENNVTSADREDIQDVLDGVNELLEDQNLPQAEKDRLEDIKEEAEGLLDTIDAAADAVDTEDIQKVEDKNSSNVKPEDKKDLEKAKEDLEDALKEENKGNYTEAEQKEIQKELDRINAALATIEQTEAVEAAIDALPKSVEPDLDEKTEKAIRDAKAAYDKLNDHQKSLISQTHKEKLEKLFDTLDDYKIIKGSGKKWEKGSGKSLTFTANGPDRKFKELRIDGYVVDTSNYTHKDGSTIITLKASYLQNLSTGKHTIQVVYTDGATDGKDTFRICNSGSNPATGDDMNMMLPGGIMITSLFCLAMMAMFIRRKKDRYER